MRLLLILLILVGISACEKRRDEGTSTEVGGGGSEALAVWQKTTEQIKADLRLLVATPSDLDVELLAELREKLPAKIDSATIEFKDYPLILGVETADRDNPSGAQFQNFSDCFKIQGGGDARERDAINFPVRELIKVSRVRFSCYAADSDRLRRIVLHEYLGLLGVSDAQYLKSASLLKAFESIHRFEDGLPVHWIHTCEEFEKIGEDGSIAGAGLQTSVPTATYRLAEDLDCTGRDFRRNEGWFTHKSLQANLDGNGYFIRGLRLSSNPDKDGLDSVAVFDSNCSHCTIANLRIDDLEVHSDAGLILRNAGTMANISFNGRVIPTFTHFDGARDFKEAGGIVKENMGTIENLNAEVEIRAPVSVVDGVWRRWIGGVVASNFGSIRGVHAKTVVEGTGYLGGFTAGNWGSSTGIDLSTAVRGSMVSAAGAMTALNRGRIQAVRVKGSIELKGTYQQAGRLIGMISDTLADDIDNKLPVPFEYAVAENDVDVNICATVPGAYSSSEFQRPGFAVPLVGRPAYLLPKCPESK